MNWTSLRNRLRGIPNEEPSALEEELAFHREMKAREYEAAGMTPDQARLEAARAVGNITRIHEDARDAWTFPLLRDTWRDLCLGARTLRAQPGFAIAATLALVLGIGVNASVFSVYNTLALAPYAIRDAGESVQIHTSRSAGGDRRSWGGVSWPHYRYLRDHTRTLTGIAAWTSTSVRITKGEVSWGAMAMTTSDNFFDLLGTGFAHGRGFSRDTGNERQPAPEIVLQHDTWITHFAGDPQTVGSWINLNGHSLQIVGVAAPGFVGPTPNRPALWIAGGWRDIFQPGLQTIDNPSSCCVSMIGRLGPGTARDQAQAELQTLTRQFLDSVRDTAPARTLLTTPALMASPSMSAKAAPVFLITGIASLLILLLACANVANLQIARSLARRREIAVRLSLGAGRFRIIRQFFAESLVLSLLAGAMGLAVSAWLPAQLVRFLAPPQESLTLRFEPDFRVAAFVLGLTVLTALLLGVFPAIRAMQEAGSGNLNSNEGGRSTMGGGRLRPALLASQVALCAILLSGAALLVRALDRAQHMDPGFRFADVIQLDPNLDSSGASDEAARNLLAPLMERAGALPGVVSVAHTNTVPLGNSFDGTSVPDPRGGSGRVFFGFSLVSANFLDTLGVTLVVGRGFRPADEESRAAVIVNEALAERLWPGENPLGKTLPVLGGSPMVVGVARNFSSAELSPTPQPYLFAPSRGTRSSSVLIRYSAPAVRDGLLAGLPKLARSLDGRMMASAARLEQNVDKARRAARVTASVASGLSALALLLACIGVYSVANYNVSQRTREIGVRMAMGAQSTTIVRLVLRQNLVTVLFGAVAGLAGAVAFGSILRSLLYGVRPADPVALTAAFGILAVTAAIAVLIPARRAAAVDPAVTLRHD